MMYCHHFLPSFSEHNFFCFPHSVGKYTQPLNHNVDRAAGVRDFSLHLVTSGKGYIELNNTVYTLKRGDVFFHTPYSKMRYNTSEEDRWEIYWIQFNGSTLANYLMENGFNESSLWYIKESGSLEQAFSELISEIELNNLSRPFKLSALTYSILVDFIAAAVPFASKKGLHNIDRIIHLLPQMQEQAHLPFILEEWASKANLTPNYFCNIFKKITKITPLTYITKCRILMSKQLLMADPYMQVKEIAITCGYPSISYFNKVFMKSEGVTPSEFRNSHSHENDSTLPDNDML